MFNNAVAQRPLGEHDIGMIIIMLSILFSISAKKKKYIRLAAVYDVSFDKADDNTCNISANTGSPLRRGDVGPGAQF